MRRLLGRLRAVWYDLRHRDDDPARRYWTKRALVHGPRAVLNLGHAANEYARVTDAQRQLLLGLLRAQLTPADRVVLDYGCGSGRFTTALAELVNGRAIGVDFAAPLIAVTPRAANVEYHVTDGETLPLPDNSIDVVWICLVLGCLTDEGNLRRNIEEMHRVIRPGGLVFLVENTSDLPDRAHFRFRPVSAYRAMFPWAALDAVGEYEDLGERITVLAGRTN